MNIRNIFCFLALGLTLPLAACDDGDDGDTTSSDSNAESNDTNDDTSDSTSGDETGDPSPDVDCATFCTNYIDMCLQTGKSTEFELNDDCLSACEAWDQAGVNCRNEQISNDACDQAGNMGSAC